MLDPARPGMPVGQLLLARNRWCARSVSSAAALTGGLDAEIRKVRMLRWVQPGELDQGAHWHRCP